MGKRNAPENNESQPFTPFKRQKLLQSPPTSPEFVENKQDFILTRESVDNTVLNDLMQSQWRVGKPIGKGSFGEIYLASDDISRPVTNDNAKYVAKIEPHSNGPLFVEIHCLLNTGKNSVESPLPLGMPEYIASGSHFFQSNRYRFLILQRFKCDLRSVIKNRRINVKYILIIAEQVLDILEHFHDNGYAHNDIKAENLMIGSYNVNEHPKNRWTENVGDDSTQNVKAATATLHGRPCRIKKQNLMNDFVFTSDWSSRRQLRPHKNVKYIYDDEDVTAANDDDVGDIDYGKKMTKSPRKPQSNNNNNKSGKKAVGSNKNKFADHIYLIDFGLASKFVDSNGIHHPFCMDQRRAHDGTLDFTSRDAHMGAHSRRSDLECLGYNIMYWCFGSLPWKDEKLQNQPEQVHRMKEIFMTDATEMLRLIYGQQVPKFLGEYFHYVDKLAYDERPDYDYLRRMFHREFIQLGYKKSEMQLNLDDLKKSCVALDKIVKSADNHCEKIKNVKSIAKLGLLIPINDKLNSSRNSGIGCRISPKNLRSKTEKLPKKNKKRFSWAEILSQDPDQIARQRAEKEFERDETTDTPTKYKGHPTYAILEIENRLKSKDNNNENRNVCQDDDYIKGYTKAMMDVVRKRNASLAAPIGDEKEVLSHEENKVEQKNVKRGRRKSDNPTKFTVGKGVNSKNKTDAQIHDNFYIRSTKKVRKNEIITQQLTPPNTTDESSCSSANSDGIIKKHREARKQGRYSSKKNGSTGTNSRSSSHSSLLSISSSETAETYSSSGISSSEFFDDDESLNVTFSPIKTRTGRQTNVKKKPGRPVGRKSSSKTMQKLSPRI